MLFHDGSSATQNQTLPRNEPSADFVHVSRSTFLAMHDLEHRLQFVTGGIGDLQRHVFRSEIMRMQQPESSARNIARHTLMNFAQWLEIVTQRLDFDDCRNCVTGLQTALARVPSQRWNSFR